MDDNTVQAVIYSDLTLTYTLEAFGSRNQLYLTVNNLTNIATNTEASKSRIMDTDYSKETTNLAKSQIIQQAATAMLAQANQSQSSVLSLLKQ